MKKSEKIVFHGEYYGIFLGIIGYICYSFSAVFAKLAIDVNTSMLLFLRNVMLFLFLLPFLGVKKLSLKTKKFPILLLRGLVGLAAVFLFYYIVKKISLVNSTLLLNTYPLFLPFIALVWFRKKIPLRRVFLLIVGFIGVIFVLQPSLNFFNTYGLFGLIAGFLIAISIASIRKLAPTEHAGVMMFYQTLILLIGSLIPAIFFWESITSPIMWLYLLLVGVFAFVYQYFIIKAYTYAPVSKVSVAGYCMVIMGGIFDVIIWNRIPSIWDIIGMALVIISGLFIILDKKQAVPIGKKIKD